MKQKYWVQFGWENINAGIDDDFWVKTSDFITVGEGCELLDLEQWWVKESAGDLQHELLQVVKL